ncbi:MAG: ribonuclease HI [Bdellovibrionaceae bacterium]|nr:ribonuclease HI [Pseudobdellovibrionaceae bacterium]MDW8189540.1 ribonuclease H [Pseudobdellovibrionaceae bacterium]
MNKHLQNPVVILFTDGSSSGNPGPGGWGFILSDQAQVIEGGGFESQTTNNRMELMALIKGLECYLTKITQGQKLKIYSDSIYLILSMTRWLPSWKKNGMTKKDGEAVKNPDLLLRLWELLSQINVPIEWYYVPAHQGIPANERVDQIAVQMGKSQIVQPPLFEGPIEHYFLPLLSGLHLAQPGENLSLPQSSSPKPQPLGYLVYVNDRVSLIKDWSTAESLVKNQKKALFKKIYHLDEARNLLRTWGVTEEKIAQFLNEISTA